MPMIISLFTYVSQFKQNTGAQQGVLLTKITIASTYQVSLVQLVTDK